MGQTLKTSKTIKPFNAVIFGGDGDLALRKIYPALFHRFVDNQINCEFTIFAITRSTRKHSEFYTTLGAFIEQSIDYELDRSKIDIFLKKIELVNIPTHSEADYLPLKVELEKTATFQNIFYLLRGAT